LDSIKNDKDLRRKMQVFWEATEAITNHQDQVAEELGVLVEDPTVWVSDQITGGRVPLMRRRIKYGRFMAARMMKQEVVGLITKIMGPWNTEDFQGKTEAEADGDANALAAAIDELTSGEVRTLFLNPLLNRTGDPVFTAPKTGVHDQLIPQMVIRESWDKSAGDLSAFLRDIHERYDAHPDGMYEFTSNFFGTLIRLYHEARKIATKVDHSPLDPHGVMPHYMMDARTNSHLPKEWLTSATYTKVDANVQLSKIASVAAFGRDFVKLVNMLDAAKQEANTENVQLFGHLEANEEYKALPTERKRKAYIRKTFGAEAAKRMGVERRVHEEIGRIRDSLVALFAAPGGGFKDTKFFEEFIKFNQTLVLRTPKSGLWNMMSLMAFPTRMGYGSMGVGAGATALFKTVGQGVGSILTEVAQMNLNASDESRTLNWIRSEGASNDMTWKGLLNNAGVTGNILTGPAIKVMRGLTNTADQSVRGMFGMKGQTGYTPFNLLTSPFNYLGNLFGVAGGLTVISLYRNIITRGIEHARKNPLVYSDPSFRFKIKDLNIWRLGDNKRSLDYLSDAWAERTGESLVDFVRRADARLKAGQDIFGVDDFIVMNQIYQDDIGLEGGMGSTPAWMRTSGVGRIVSPLLKWAVAASNQAHLGLKTQEGRLTVASTIKGLAGMAAYTMPIGLAAAALMEDYDEETLSKKSNLRTVGPTNLLPGVAMYNLATGSPESLAIVERLARSGLPYGAGGEAISGMLNWTDDTAGQRSLGINRILAYNQIRGALDVFLTALHSDWSLDYNTKKKAFDIAFGQAPSHFTQHMNTFFPAGNEGKNIDSLEGYERLREMERRRTKRIDAQNYIRMAARISGIQLRKGGFIGSPTPLTTRIKQMQLMAYGDDKEGFNTQLNIAIELAYELGKEDPMGSISQSWAARHPLKLLSATPTPSELRKLMATMNERGVDNVTDLIELHDKFARYLKPTPLPKAPPRRGKTKRLDLLNL
jgi:hypothetical protein